MSRRGEVLIAVIINKLDLEIAYERHWYRIPVGSVEKYLKQCWPPEWIAFYQTKTFGWQGSSIRYYAQVQTIERMLRRDLFPEASEILDPDKPYYRLNLAPLEELPEPIVNSKRRRITFIPTTLVQLMTAVEIRDLNKL